MRSGILLPFLFTGFISVHQVVAQSIEAVTLSEVGRYQHPYVLFPDSFSAPTLSSRIDRLGRPYIYMACADSGLFTLDITDPATPVVVDRKYPSEFAGLKVMNVEQIGELLYLSLGDFASQTQAPGLAIMDVAEPSDPVMLDMYAHAPFNHGCAIVQVHDGYAYLGAMEHGIVVLDVSDPTDIQFHSTYLPDPSWPGVANYPPNARGMTIVDDVLYLAFDAGALRAIDISVPAQLTEIGRYFNPQHPAFTNPAYNNVVAIGDRLYCTIDYCGFEVVDISDPTDMVQVDWLNPWNCSGLSWFGSDGHANELITALNDSLLFMSGGDSEVLVYDITDRDDPVLKGGHILPNDSASAWGVDVFGDLVVANYINNHGLPLQPYDSKYGGVVLFRWEVDISTGVSSKVGSEDIIRIQPNPTTGKFTVRIGTSGRSGGLLQVIDPQGRSVIEKSMKGAEADSGSFEMDLTGLAPGIYHLTLQSDRGLQIARIVLLGN